MKTALFVLLSVLAIVCSVGPVVAIGTMEAGCTKAETLRALTIAEDAARAACILGNAELPTTAAVAKACGLAEEEFPIIESTIAAHKLGVRRAVAAALADAGAR